MTDKIKINLELHPHELDMLLNTVNALKDFNNTTAEKCDITYNHICGLEGTERLLARVLGFEQPECEHGYHNPYGDYEMTNAKRDK